MKSIYSYLDYRTFLTDFLADEKKKRSYLSYRYIGQKLNLDASNIAKVLQKKRHLSTKGIHAFATFCNLSRREERYFQTLVQHNKERSPEKKRELEEVLLNIKFLSPQKLQNEQYEYYHKWYNSAILALLYYFDFRSDYKKLGEMLDPQISETEAKESIATLEKLHLIKKNSNGVYIHTHELLSTGDEWCSIAIRSFQRETLRLALRSFETHHKNIRDISTATITISNDDLKELRKATQEYRNRVLQIIDESDNPEHVYQLNIQLFPLTQGVTPCK